MNDLFLGVFFGVVGLSAVLLLFIGLMTPNVITDHLIEGDILGDHYDRVGLISCDSDSMGLSINCGDVAYSKSITIDEELVLGEIYLYKLPDINNSVIHRYVLDLGNGSLIFKGDNNEYAELVNREWVFAKPLYLKYG